MYKITSLGDGGFDEITRPDLKSAKGVAKVHERATGNECEITLIEEDEDEFNPLEQTQILEKANS